MDVSFLFPCLVIGAAVIAFTGSHKAMWRWINKRLGWSHQRQLSNNPPISKSLAYWVMYGIIIFLVLVTILLVVAFVVSAFVLSQLHFTD